MELAAAGSETPERHFRAILVENGQEILGIQTDPGTVVSLRLVSN